MDITAFPLFWRWTQPSYSVLPADALETLCPLETELVDLLCASAPKTLGPRTIKHHATENTDETRRWLASLPVPVSRVVIAWGRDTALSLPWDIFVTYWSDFCYPSSDDVDVFVEGGPVVLRWHHDETFEYDADAL
ncbi:hypothetical protein [Polaromonas sp. JS666]|uniref:hypothetical protein n=1 Tax=Polaromonas sp. (strain JS666 / ATCC BAA-500) TaxID=296591 RepID=UPI00067492B7|nr:hypothetical protein [Polaromonas sp. JS666]UUZ71607.1 hypothetical protein LP415_22340 [Polaromonas sp. P1(28)-8]